MSVSEDVADSRIESEQNKVPPTLRTFVREECANATVERITTDVANAERWKVVGKEVSAHFLPDEFGIGNIINGSGSVKVYIWRDE